MSFRTQIHKKKFDKNVFHTLQGYYVPPPIDQCLKFKNHCSLVGNGHAAVPPHPQQAGPKLPSPALNAREKVGIYVDSLGSLWKELRILNSEHSTPVM
jgi:hypothetical protein